MRTVKLKHIVDIEKGKKHSVSAVPSSGSRRLLQIEDLRHDFELKYTDDQFGVQADVNDVLLAWDGAKAGTVGYGKQGMTGSTIARLRVKDPASWDGAFLGLLLQSKYDYFQRTSTGATIPHINRRALQSIEVPLFALDDQRRIAALLSRAEGLIAQRKESLRLLDELVRSVFLEMFGDPVRNEKRWELSTLGNYTDFLTSGSRGWAEHYAEEGDWFFRIQNVGRGEMLLNDVQRVTAPTTQEAERTRVRPGDLLMSITADLGRTAVVPPGTPTAYINQHLALIRLNDIDPLYVSHFYATAYGQAVIQKRNKSNVKAGLNFTDIKSFPLVVPSKKTQVQYTHMVERIREHRAHQQNSLLALEQLYGSLCQRAFRGELTEVAMSHAVL
jgi:type I restriction enzyme S subunit